MNEPAWIDDPRLTPLVDKLVAATVKQYRVEPDAARRMIRESFAGLAWEELISRAKNPGDIERTRAFKDAAASAKRQIYHALRRYVRDGREHEDLLDQLAATDGAPSGEELSALVLRIVSGHASTAERLPHEAAFYDFLLRALGDARQLIDVGCGLQPLRFPFDRSPVALYAACDSSGREVATVGIFAKATGNRRLLAWRDDLGEGWRRTERETGVGQFDVALLLKLLPVVARQSRELLPTLRATPARRWIVSGSTTALAKRDSIERRERAALKKFVADADRKIVDEFLIGEEFGYVVE